MSLDGVLVLDKPAGPTSHDMVDRVRSRLHVRRVGHTGTLDPFATGVLPICVGRATRLARFLAASEKTYRARVRFGFATATDDLNGEALGAPAAVAFDAAELEAACQPLRGEVLQRPPSYSAKRVGGRRLYERARAGEAVVAEAVRVRIGRLEVVEFSGGHAEINVECSSGTYVRAIARDLGEALGCGAHLVALRRTRAAGFGVEEALGGDFDGEAARGALIPLERTLLELPAVVLTPEGAVAVGTGRNVSDGLARSPLPRPLPPRVRLFDEQGRLLALAVPAAGSHAAGPFSLEPALHPDVVLVDSH